MNIMREVRKHKERPEGAKAALVGASCLDVRGGRFPSSIVTPSTVLFVLLSCLLVAHASAACSGYGMMESGKTRITVEGRKVSFTPLKGSAVFADFFNLTLTITNITERNPPAPVAPATIPECNWAANAEVDAIQAWQLANFDCTIVQSFYIRPEDSIRVDYITINYTIASTPGLVITNTFYATNGSFVEKPSTNSTYVDPGREYTWKYDKESIKWSYEIYGMPWTGRGGTMENPDYFSSYMALYLQWGAQVNNINITIFDEPYDGGFELTSRKTGDIAKASFEKGYLYDGIPWYQAEKINSTYKVTEVPFSTGDYFYPLYSGVAFCTPFHYEKVIYDPTLSVLFGSSPSPNGAPSSSSNAWKIAVGVSLGAVAIIILIIVLLVVFYAPFRNLVRPYSGRKKTSANDNNLDTSLSHSPKNQGSTAANKKSEPSWNSAQKPLSV